MLEKMEGVQGVALSATLNHNHISLALGEIQQRFSDILG
jgi:hypothetical protein